MADIIFNYVEMENAASAIDTLATKYATAATTLDSDFQTAIKDWEGVTKDAMSKFVSGPVTSYTGTTVPNIIKALATLLRSNAKQMGDADQQIADNIPTTLSQGS